MPVDHAARVEQPAHVLAEEFVEQSAELRRRQQDTGKGIEVDRLESLALPDCKRDKSPGAKQGIIDDEAALSVRQRHARDARAWIEDDRELHRDSTQTRTRSNLPARRRTAIRPRAETPRAKPFRCAVRRSRRGPK